MLIRITHAAIAFAATSLAYQVYVATVVPFVEPASTAARRVRQGTPTEWETGRAAPNQYQQLLTAYFPQDHWSVVRSPKILENGQVMFVLDEYQQSDSGRLTIPRCAAIYFRQPRDRGAPPPPDAIILEPSGGAVLQMDQRLGQTASGFGRMQFGQLLGEVVVRSDMRDPGPQDDLLITTRDLYMNEDLIRTAESVEMRLGEHLGRGRGLEIRRLRAEDSGGDALSKLYGSFDSLEISNDVSAVVAPGKLSIPSGAAANVSLAGGGAGRGASPDSPTRGNSTNGHGQSTRTKFMESPFRIKSEGPFRIDFGNYVASFLDRVKVRQLHPDGKLDELDAAELNLYFTKVRRWEGDIAVDPSNDAAESDAPASAFDSFALEPETIEAKGTPASPVRLTAPSYDATARGERLYIERTPQRVTLEGGEEVTLTYRGSEIHAPMVRYEHPPQGSLEQLGQLRARGGGGRLQTVVDPTRPDQILEVTWKESMQLVRRHGQPVLVLDGRPRVSMIPMGTLYADNLELFLRDDGKSGESGDGGGGLTSAVPSTVKPERLRAVGHVVIQSAELNGRVNELDLKIDSASPDARGAAGGVNSQSGALFSPRQRQAGRRCYDIDGVVLRINAVMRDRRPEVTGMSVDGAVVFQESTTFGGGEPSLRIAAERLEVTGADTPNALIDVVGGDNQNGRPAQLAEIVARGTVIRAPRLTVNRGTSQARVNSPGEVQMQVDRDATGAPLAQPQRLSITWQDSMNLDVDHITFAGDVRVQHADGWLSTRRLIARLTAPVRFDGGADQQKPELAQLECWEGVLAEFGQRDQTGAVVSHQRMSLESLEINQVSGAIAGNGPGHVDSVHLSRGTNQWINAPGAAGPPAVVAENNAPSEATLRHLSVDFLRHVEGNLHARYVSVHGDVKTVYGPVNDWTERVKMIPGGRPGPQTLWITCDELRVGESPVARIAAPADVDGRKKPIGQLELLAATRVVIEGEDPSRGAFTLRGERASYDQAKTMLVLEGGGGQPATISHQQYPGAPPSDQSIQKITYFMNTGQWILNDAKKIQWQMFDQVQEPDANPRR